MVLKLPLATNPRAKMAGFRDGFVKLFTSPGTGVVLGGVIVAPRASELILAVSVAMEQRLTAEQLAHHVRRLPVPVRQHHRGGPQADGVHPATASSRGPALMRGTAQVGIAGVGQAVLAQPGRADVVGVGRPRTHHAARTRIRTRTIIALTQGWGGQEYLEHHHHDRADRQDHHEGAAARSAYSPARVGQLVPHPVHVPVRGNRNPKATKPEPSQQPWVTRPGWSPRGQNRAAGRARPQSASRQTAAPAGRVCPISTVSPLTCRPCARSPAAPSSSPPAPRPGRPRTPVSLGDRDLDDRALHRAGQRVPSGPGGSRPPPPAGARPPRGPAVRRRESGGSVTSRRLPSTST